MSAELSLRERVISRLVDWIIAGAISCLGIVLLYLAGAFNSAVKSYILNSLQPHISTDSRPNGNYTYVSSCPQGDLIVGGTCLVTHGGAYIQNTQLVPADAPTQFQCVFGQASSEFTGEAHAICLRSRDAAK
jgi:hypothetical protein